MGCGLGFRAWCSLGFRVWGSEGLGDRVGAGQGSGFGVFQVRVSGGVFRGRKYPLTAPQHPALHPHCLTCQPLHPASPHAPPTSPSQSTAPCGGGSCPARRGKVTTNNTGEFRRSPLQGGWVGGWQVRAAPTTGIAAAAAGADTAAGAIAVVRLPALTPPRAPLPFLPLPFPTLVS